MSSRIFIIDDDEVAREIELMLKTKERQRILREYCKYPTYENEVRYGGCGSVGCGVSRPSRVCSVGPSCYRPPSRRYGCGSFSYC